MRKRASQSRPEPISGILRKILKKRSIPDVTSDRQLVDLWTRAVGPQIAVRTRPEATRRGKLHVRVSSPTWLHQLQFMKEEILQRLNELGGKQEFQLLHFSIGEIPPLPAPRSAAAPGPLPPLPESDRAQVCESLRAIADPELREILERVMTLEISRRRERERRRGSQRPSPSPRYSRPPLDR